MAENLCCNVCDRPFTFDDATDIAVVPSNVRKFQDESFTVWRCGNCDSLHSKEDVDLDRYYVDYFVHRQRLDYFARGIFGCHIRIMRKFGMRKNHSVLDYGCGPGLAVTLLRERGYKHAVGYDPYVPEYADPRILERQYDVVLSSEVIEHVAEPSELMVELAGLVKPGGLLVVGTPNATHICLQQSDIHLLVLHQPFHQHILSERAISGLGQRAGLKQLYLTRRNWDSLWPARNYRFMREYVRAAGNLVDVIFDPPRLGMVFTSPRLLFYAVCGYWFPPKTMMLAAFEKDAQVVSID